MRMVSTKELKFDEKTHTYTLGKKKLRSVTEWVHSFFPKFDEKSISKYVAKARRNKGEKITSSQVRAEWHKIANDGTKTHKQIEMFINGKYAKAIKKPMPRLQAAVCFLGEKAEEWRNAIKKPEYRIFSEELGLAGTADLVVLHEDDCISIIDWKTNNSIKVLGKTVKVAKEDIMDCNYSHYALQLSTYAYILEKEYSCIIKDLILVNIHEGGIFHEMKVPYLRNTVEAMINEDRNK